MRLGVPGGVSEASGNPIAGVRGDNNGDGRRFTVLLKPFRDSICEPGLQFITDGHDSAGLNGFGGRRYIITLL